jgi:hypothetical protein
MSHQDTKYLYFYVKDYTNTYTTSGYTLPITPFTFIPVLDTGSNDLVSNTRLLWNFGDGTTSRDVTATHAYSMPGTYNVTCHFYTTGGEGYESAFTQSIVVVDYITDALIISASPVNVIEAGHYQNPYTIARFNSWQTYPALSTQGTTILLYASGSDAPLIDVDLYEREKYAHLKPYARFLVYEYNNITQQNELVPVESIKTTNNQNIYVKLNQSNNIVRCNASDAGSTLAGTSGDRIVFFANDSVKTPISGAATPRDVITVAFFDTTQMVDADSYNTQYASEYPVLRQVVDSSFIPKFIDQSDITHLTITSNGVDGEGVVLTSFNISPNKFVGQKIPFVVRVKDSENFTTKSASVLTLTSGDLQGNTVRVELLSSNGTVITDGVEFYSDFGELSTATVGGFFKGYLMCSQPYENVHLHATAQLSGAEYFTIPSYHMVISHPESRYIHRVEITTTPSYKLTENLINTPALTGIYTAVAIPTKDPITRSIDTMLWVADADNDSIYKMNTNGQILLSATFDENASPSNITSNSDGDIWVSLYDGVSTVRISNATGEIVACAVPPFLNEDWSSESLYIELSGYAGQNSLLPTAVDTDRYDSLWVTYSNPLSGYICKYDNSGAVLTAISTPDTYQATDVITTLNKGVWVILKDTSNNTMLSGQDAIMCISNSTSAIYTFELSATLWNMTIDVNEDLWITSGRSDVIHFDTTTCLFSTYNLLSSDTIADTCDFAGIGCTTENYIVVVDDARKQLVYFDANSVVSTTISGISSLLLTSPADISGGYINADMLNAYGDWTGFRHINKHFHRFGLIDGLEGDSSVFNIYPETGKYSIGKKNENINPAAQYRAHVFQEAFADYTNLIENFFGAAVGNADSPPEAIGKRLYERIANFVDNVINVDTCGLDMLESLHVMFDKHHTKLQSYNFNYPSNMNRIMDLLSIKFSKLRGERNKYNTNFNARGHLNLTEDLSFLEGVKYGRNRGSELDFFTTILTGGVDGYIVAYEKFSEQYHLINTNLVSASFIDYKDAVLQTYALSSYDLQGRWGWGLVLPSNVTNEDIDKYYTFYNYSSALDNKQIAGIINWSDSFTTISENISSIQQWSDIAENMITYTLAEGLELLSGSSI